jgi:hypothetical protein
MDFYAPRHENWDNFAEKSSLKRQSLTLLHSDVNERDVEYLLVRDEIALAKNKTDPRKRKCSNAIL